MSKFYYDDFYDSPEDEQDIIEREKYVPEYLVEDHIVNMYDEVLSPYIDNIYGREILDGLEDRGFCKFIEFMEYLKE